MGNPESLKHLGEEIYNLFCECIHEVQPSIKTFSWDILSKEQKITWGLLQKKLNSKKGN